MGVGLRVGLPGCGICTRCSTLLTVRVGWPTECEVAVARLLQYKRDVTTAHNRLVQRVLPRYGDVPTFMKAHCSQYDGVWASWGGRQCTTACPSLPSLVHSRTH